MAHWITRYEGPPGWQTCTKCVCSSCGKPADQFKVIDMDGYRWEYRKSRYCPNCSELMEGEQEQKYFWQR